MFLMKIIRIVKYKISNNLSTYCLIDYIVFKGFFVTVKIWLYFLNEIWTGGLSSF